ncbi:MAG: hypothetical protein K6G31_12865 [Paludibacteraceae bacterium]|nr:hypothetical protein [Paludibacteraceae bacterium]
MGKLINKMIFVIMALGPWYSILADDTSQFFTFALDKSNVSVSDSVKLIIENKMQKDSLLCTDIILYAKDSNGIYNPYLEDVELLSHPVPITDIKKWCKRTTPVPPLSKRTITFFINQPYVTRKEISKSGKNFTLVSNVDEEIRLGQFLLGVRFRFSGDVVWRYFNVILPINRYQ